MLFCWVSRVSILIFLWYSWNFYQEENSAMAYTRKCSVYLKCLYEHTKANNYCHKPREQLLMAWVVSFALLCAVPWLLCPCPSCVLLLTSLCTSWIPVQVKSLFFHLPITCWALLLWTWECFGVYHPKFITHLLLDPLLVILVGPFQLRIFSQYSEYCHKPGTEGLIFNYTLLGLDSGRNNDKELSKLFKTSYKSVWTYSGPACFIEANAVTMANLGLIVSKKGRVLFL